MAIVRLTTRKVVQDFFFFFFFFFFFSLVFSRGAEPIAKKKRGPAPLDASNAPKGHPKQAFMPQPHAIGVSD